MEKLKLLCKRAVESDKFWLGGIFLVTFAAFAPSLGFRELISDDNSYVINALSVKNSFWRIFEPVLYLRTPLTSLSLYCDFLIWGEKNFYFGAHLLNILLHSGTAVVFYLLLRNFKWNGTPLSPVWAGVSALIFALHPQRVESVVWLCERKDCLAMFLGTAALLLFFRGVQKEKISWGSAVLLVLSISAKPLWIFFFVPAAALIWMEKRSFPWKTALKLLFPSLLLFLLFLAWVMPGMIQGLLEAGTGKGVPLLFKIETILHSYGNYFIRTFLPGNLFPLYPYYNPSLDPRWMALVPLLLLLTPLLARNPEFREAVIYGVVPLLVCFAAVLIPMIGLVRLGNTDFADRYSYLPSLFLIGGAAFLLKLNLPSESAFGRWLPVLAVLYCGGMLWKTEHYIPVWKTNQATVERSIAPAAPNFNAVITAAVMAYQKGEFEKAGRLCKEKLLEFPHYPEDYGQIMQIFKLSMQGLILFKLGREEEGIRYLNTVYMSPRSGMVHNFPVNFAQKVFTTGAEYHLRKYNDRKAAANLYRRCSYLFKVHSNLYEAFYAGMAALTEMDYQEAARQFRLAYEIYPRDRRLLQNLNYALQKLKEQKK